MKSKKIWSWIGLFMIVLIVMLPVYSADVLAVSVQITKNQGEAGIEGFIDGEGDTWTVEAKVSGAEPGAVSAEKVTLKILPDGFPVAFNLCQSSTLETVCTYQNQLSGISAGIFNFEVGYSYFDAEGYSRTAPAFGTISSDRFAPQISRPEISTNAENIKFSVDDSLSPARRHTPSSGLQKVEIVDDDNERVLKTFTTFTDNKKFEYDGPLEVTLSGEGNRYFKIRAGDNLGHSEESETVELATDFVAPVIGAVELKGLEEGFIGENSITTDLVVEVTETNDVMVTAASEQIGIYDEEGVCLPDEEEIDLWHCEWQEVVVLPLEQVSVTITAEDEFGNVNTNTYQFPKFTKDETPPEIVEFGTPHSYEGKYYIKSGEQKIILKVTDVGSWFDEEEPGNNILANLRALGVSSNRKAPACQLAEDGSSFDCYWETTGRGNQGDKKTISLVKFEDRVGNPGTLPSIDLIIDKENPVVEEVAVYGFSDVDVGTRDYFQSGDDLIINLKVREATGLVVKVDLNDALNDADQTYPATPDNEEGWAVFTSDEYCDKEGGLWSCELKTEEIKSGFEPFAEIKVEVGDTAGNLAVNWPAQEKVKNVKVEESEEETQARYSFAILGVADDPEPNFWEVEERGIEVSPPFIDLDTANLIPPRISFEIPLSANEDTELRRVEGECALSSEWEGPDLPILRTLVYGGLSGKGSAAPLIVVEFMPFDGPAEFADIMEETFAEERNFQVSEVPLDCMLRIYSSAGNNVLKYAEMQEVKNLKVPFAFTELGAMDENLAGRIKETKESTYYKVVSKIGYLKKIVYYAELICKGYQTLRHLIELWHILNGTIGVAEDATREVPGVGAGVTASRMGSCKGAQAAEETADEGLMKTFNSVCKLISCEATNADWAKGWYDEWVSDGNRVLREAYWDLPTQLAGGIESNDAYLNPKNSLVMSFMTGCIPGIIHNLDKVRQVQCVYINCLQKDVAAGLATVESCENMKHLFFCKYIMGELFELIPFVNWIKYWAAEIRKILLEPFSYVLAGAMGWLCTPSCEYPNAWPNFTCALFAAALKGFEIYNDVVSIQNTLEWGLPYDYCEQIEEEDEEEGTGGSTGGTREGENQGSVGGVSS